MKKPTREEVAAKWLCHVANKYESPNGYDRAAWEGSEFGCLAKQMLRELDAVKSKRKVKP